MYYNIQQCNPCYDIYVNSFKDDFRDGKMSKRFYETGLTAKIYKFNENDPRAYTVADNRPELSRGQYGNLFSFLTMIEDFYNYSDKEYAVILENDVFLKKNIAFELKKACEIHKNLGLDILLIGYLSTCTPAEMGFEEITNNQCYEYKCYRFPDDLWGSHGFIINKKHAKYFMDKYTIEYVTTLTDVGGDWIYSKDGNRALMYPPLVVEEGYVKTDHYGQITYHMNCRNYQYNDSYTL